MATRQLESAVEARLPMKTGDGPFDQLTQAALRLPSDEQSARASSLALRSLTRRLNLGHKTDAAQLKHNKTARRLLLKCMVIVAVTPFLALSLRSFAVQAFYVPSDSMLPTLQVGDRIVIDKVGFTVRRGDIVVFRRVPADNLPSAPDLVKRVIGMPGETISSRGSVILVNGKPLAEPWLPALKGECEEAGVDIATTRIPPHHYFVMGDCRGDSADSRSWGTVPASYVIGTVVAIVWRYGRPYVHWF